MKTKPVMKKTAAQTDLFGNKLLQVRLQRPTQKQCERTPLMRRWLRDERSSEAHHAMAIAMAAAAMRCDVHCSTWAEA